MGWPGRTYLTRIEPSYFAGIGVAAPFNYKRCRIHHFLCEINADGSVRICCHMKYNSKYIIGNINEQSFADIWKSERRQQVYNNIDFKDCAQPCKLVCAY